MATHYRHTPPTRETGLRWAMRAIGVVLAVAAGFLLNYDYFHTPVSFAFLAGSGALGVATVLMSWLPSSGAPAFEEAEMAPDHARVPR